MQRKRLTYIPAFDGLRGLAVLPVVLLHVGVAVLPSSRLLGAVTRGWYGVDLFFVLSGFIICHVHWNDIGRPEQVRSYFWKRFVRIYPTYWVALALFVLLFLFSP